MRTFLPLAATLLASSGVSAFEGECSKEDYLAKFGALPTYELHADAPATPPVVQVTIAFIFLFLFSFFVVNQVEIRHNLPDVNVHFDRMDTWLLTCRT